MIRRTPVVFALLLSAFTLTAAQNSKKTHNQAQGPLPITTHEKFATFLAGEDFRSLLLLENLRPDKTITFTPVLIVKDGEVPLEPVTVSAHSAATVDINAALKARGLPDKQGSVAVRFDFNTYGPGAAVVQMSDEKHQIFLNSYAQSSEEYWGGTDYDAVVWTPQEGTQGFIAITNASNEAHSVRTAFLVGGRSEQRPDIQIPARQTRIVPIDDLLSHSRKSGAGIHIEYDQAAGEEYPGAILVEGQIFNDRNGFAKRIHFMDKALPPTGTLRTQFLMVGVQPAEDGFPANTSFHSVAAIRNIDNSPVTVSPTVKFVQNGFVKAVNLRSRELATGESEIIDFNEEQKAGRLPSDFSQGSIELTPNTGRNSIVGEMFNFSDSTGGFVIGPTFSSYPARSTASVWRIDGTFQTTIVVENTASVADTVSLRLYSDHNAYIKTFNVGAGGLLKINVRDLQQNAVPDDKGIFLTATSGVVSLVGGHNIESKLAYDKIIHSLSQADYVGYTSSPCDYVTGISLFVDFSSGNQPFPLILEYDWSMSGPEDDAALAALVSDGSLAQISYNGTAAMVTFTPPNDGLIHEITIDADPTSQVVPFCDACSAGTEFVSSFKLPQFKLATTKSQTDFSNPLTNTKVTADGKVYCALQDYCTPETSPPACGPIFTLQSPFVAGGPASCGRLYVTSWFAERAQGETLWTCFPILPGQNATATLDPSLGECTPN